MIKGSYGIAFDVKGISSMEDVKHGLHKVLARMFGNYYDKSWTDTRVFLELTTGNVFLENADLTRALFCKEVTELESNIYQEFKPSSILAFCLDDSSGGRGFSLLETDTQNKRVWVDSEYEGIKKFGEEISEESFIKELTETNQEDWIVYTHAEYEKPMYGQRGIIEKVIRRILLNRFMFDYEWQEYRGNITLLDTEDFPIQDLQLLYGDT